MSNNNVIIPLVKREDKNGKVFYIAKVKSPMTIDLSKGATFFIFAAEDGVEEMQIAPFQEREERKEIKDTYKVPEVYTKRQNNSKQKQNDLLFKDEVNCSEE